MMSAGNKRTWEISGQVHGGNGNWLCLLLLRGFGFSLIVTQMANFPLYAARERARERERCKRPREREWYQKRRNSPSLARTPFIASHMAPPTVKTGVIDFSALRLLLACILTFCAGGRRLGSVSPAGLWGGLG